MRLAQPIFRGFSTTAENERTDAVLESAQFRAVEGQEGLALQISQAYLDVLRSQELVVLAQENLDLHYETQNKVKQRHESDVGDRSDMTQIAGRISRAEENLMASRNELMDSRTRFVALVGEVPVGLVRPVPDEDYFPQSRMNATSVALANNPTLRLSVADVRSAEAEVKSRESQYYPQFDLVLEAGRRYDVSGFDGEEEDARAVLEMNWNLFNGFRDTKESKAIRYRESQARMTSNQARRQLIERIDTLWSAYMTTEANRTLLRSYVASTKETEVLYQAQFKVNRRSLLDLLDSENELFEARRSYLDADYRVVLHKFQIMAAMGVLLESMRIDSALTLDNESKDDDPPDDKSNYLDSVHEAHHVIDSGGPAS